MIDALVGFGAVFVLALLRNPLAFAMGLVGFVGLGLLRGWPPTMANAAQVVYDTGFAYTLSVVPLFILMGNFVARAEAIWAAALPTPAAVPDTSALALSSPPRELASTT